MAKKTSNRVVITDEDRNVERIKTDKEIVEENAQLEAELKGKKKKTKKKTSKAKSKKKQELEAILEEKKAAKAAEKAKKEAEAKEEEMTVMLVDQQDRALNWGIVGVGQAGGKLAECFYNRGYNTVILNTALQDMKFITVPERQKLFLDYSIGGAGKDLDAGREAVEQYSEEIVKHVDKHTDECDVLMLICSGGGGTGSGSAETMCNLLNTLGKPVICLYVLPMSSEDVQAQHNSIQTLSRLAKMASTDVISALTIVDNSKIELQFPNLSLSDFWKQANTSIVEPLHLFNMLSAQPSEHGSLDPSDFARCLLGSDCSLYGMIELDDYAENEEAIAEAVLLNTENGLLSSNFDLVEARNVGVIVTGSKKALDETPASHMEYGLAMLSKLCGESSRIFRGVYEMPNHPDTLRIYCLFSGLGLPQERIAELKASAQKHMKALESKEQERASNMNVDLGQTQTTSAVDQMHRKIQKKNSPMSKLKKNSRRVIDRRRR